MKKIVLLLTMVIVLTSCMTSNFALTGTLHQPLPTDYPIKVILTENKENIEYEEIGALQIKQSDMDNLSKAIELAKTEARVRGGDILFLISLDSKTAVSGNQYGVFSSEKNSYIFVVGKMKK